MDRPGYRLYCFEGLQFLREQCFGCSDCSTQHKNIEGCSLCKDKPDLPALLAMQAAVESRLCAKRGSHQICKRDKGNLCALQGRMHVCSQGCHCPEESVIGKAVFREKTRFLAEYVVIQVVILVLKEVPVDQGRCCVCAVCQHLLGSCADASITCNLEQSKAAGCLQGELAPARPITEEH